MNIYQALSCSCREFLRREISLYEVVNLIPHGFLIPELRCHLSSFTVLGGPHTLTTGCREIIARDLATSGANLCTSNSRSSELAICRCHLSSTSTNGGPGGPSIEISHFAVSSCKFLMLLQLPIPRSPTPRDLLTRV
jgi:hypothetical protein